MSLNDRDKKIVTVLVPILLLAGFWFLLLAPKRADSARLGEEQVAAEQKRDASVSKAQQLEGARNTYADDYATVVRLGKAIPSSVDMPSLLVQLEFAARGTGIDFDSVKAGPRTSSATAAPAPAASSAQTGPGKAAQTADNAKAGADKSAATAGATSADGSTSTTPPATGSPTAAPGLDSVPLDFTFTGSFTGLADFLHRMKRFVRVANSKISVKGRLMTIDTLAFKSTAFPTLEATVKATVYLAPKSEGATAGATPAGPDSAPASSAPAPSSAAPPSTPDTAPTGAAQ